MRKGEKIGYFYKTVRKKAYGKAAAVTMKEISPDTLDVVFRGSRDKKTTSEKSKGNENGITSRRGKENRISRRVLLRKAAASLRNVSYERTHV